MSIDIIRIIGSILLFILIFGMSATVDIHSLQTQICNIRAIVTCLILQFVILPAIGCTTVKLFNLDYATGIIMLVLTSSPGGSYSNWWCSMFNADLALSVTMTAISTCLSVVLLPFNLMIYSRYAYNNNEDLVEYVDWISLATALLLVIAAICCGLYASAMRHSHDFNLTANRFGNYAGLILIIFSAFLSSSNKDARLWDRENNFYYGIAIPCITALLLANIITILLQLPHPEIVTISIESCCQNIGIATTIAMAMFNGEDLARAIAVPFYYGFLQALFTFIYCVVAWKIGWTKAPANINFCTMITTSYEILSIEQEEQQQQQKPNNNNNNKEVQIDDFCYVNHKDVPALNCSQVKKVESV